MKTLEWNTIDKSGWPRGEWDNEPDKKQWQDQETSLPCLIVRGHLGALCGYVGVSTSHPWYGTAYDDQASTLDIHGGLTFADQCYETTDESKHVCHTPGENEPNNVWWFGFDCGHYLDLHPRLPALDWGQYRNVAYVESECASLAKQLNIVR